MNSLLKGLLSEKRFITIALELGWEVALPIDHGASYDLLVRRGGAWETVQVKTVQRMKDGRVLIDIRRNTDGRSGHYKRSDFEYLVAIDWPKACYFVPYSAICQRKSISLKRSTEFEQYKIWVGQG